jgi:iron complex outermembrane recepter protein
MQHFPARRALGALGVAILSVAPAVAGAATRHPADSSGAASRRAPAPPIAGRVQDETGRPLPNVHVIVSELGRTTTTAADGTFEVRGLPAGHYHVNFLLIGYASGHVAVTVPESGAPVQVAVTLKAATVRLQTVQVTATPTGTDPLSITQATAELSDKALARSLGASVAQTLANEPGLSMRYNGPAATVPVIRGLTGERILVLQDGERAGEVVRGPASLLYGNNALGGVVNVISSDIPTAVPGHREGYFATQGESVNPGGAVSAGLTLPVGKHGVVTGRLSGRSLDDFRAGGNVRQENTFSRNQGAVLGAGYVGDGANGGLAYRGQRFDYGLPTAVGDPETGAHIEGWRHQGVGRWDVNVNRRGIQAVRLNGSAQWYRHDEVENTGEVGTRFDLQTQTVNATARTLFAPGFIGAIGVSGLFKQYAAEGEEALTPAANSANAGVFVYQEVPLRDWSTHDTSETRRPSLQFGGRYDVYRIQSRTGDPKFGPGRTKTFTNVSASFGASTPLGRVMTLSGSVARAFRAPTVEELYSNAFHAANGTYDVGNRDLKAETNTGADAILRVQSGSTSAQLAAYVNRIDNYISPNIVRDTTLDDEGSVPLNLFAQRDATLRGVEGQAEAELVRHVVAGVVGDVVRGSFVSGGPLPFMPSARLGASLRWDNGRYFAGGDVRHGFAQTRVSQAGCARADRAVVGDEGELDSEPGTGAPCVDLPTPAYTVLNLSAGVTLVVGGLSHSLTLRADNVGDTRYFDASSRIKSFTANPGRNLSLVYRLLY